MCDIGWRESGKGRKKSLWEYFHVDRLDHLDQSTISMAYAETYLDHFPDHVDRTWTTGEKLNEINAGPSGAG